MTAAAAPAAATAPPAAAPAAAASTAGPGAAAVRAAVELLAPVNENQRVLVSDRSFVAEPSPSAAAAVVTLELEGTDCCAGQRFKNPGMKVSRCSSSWIPHQS